MQTQAPANKPVLTQMVELRSSWKQSCARGMDDPENRRQDRRRCPNGEAAERSEILTTEPELPDPGLSTWKPWIAGLTTRPRQPRLAAVLLGCFGAIGLLLAALGLYRVMFVLVRSRFREIGTRHGLGWSASRDRLLDSGPERARKGRRGRGRRSLCRHAESSALQPVVGRFGRGPTNPRWLHGSLGPYWSGGIALACTPGVGASILRRFFAPSKLRKIALRPCFVNPDG